MERILHDQLCNYLTKFDFFSDTQSGFRKFQPTTAALTNGV